jgi:hypothetical protein
MREQLCRNRPLWIKVARVLRAWRCWVIPSGGSWNGCVRRWRGCAPRPHLVGCLGVPASVLAVWTHRQVPDNDRFVATVSPVIQDPLVQSALANRISAEVLGYVDVQQIADEAIDARAVQGMRPQLVERLHDLAGPLADAVAGLVHDRVGQLVASEEFTAAWNRALDVTHEQANAVLSGGRGGDCDQQWDGRSRSEAVHRRGEAAAGRLRIRRRRADTRCPPDGRPVRCTHTGLRSDGKRSPAIGDVAGRLRDLVIGRTA